MPRAIIVHRGDEEFVELVSSAGYDVLSQVYLSGKVNPRFFISRGKVEEIKRRVRKLGAERVVVDGILKSSQWYLLERELGVEVEDKVKLIISIFAKRARSREAMLQVEYAELQYQMAHIKEVIHRMRTGEHPGFMGGGEYEIADYYEMMRRKMAKIRRELERMRVHREERRKRRREGGYVLVGIAGYTNTGKSTLLRALSGRDVVIEDRMFSTLGTRTSKVGKERILVTDTVGFVKGMPPWLIGAFEPTLEEIYKADVLLLLLNCKDPINVFEERLNLSLDILESRSSGKIIPVINKVDMCPDVYPKYCLAKEISEPVLISAKYGVGMDDLIDRVKREGGIERYRVRIPSLEGEEFELISRFGKVEMIIPGEEPGVVFEMRRDLYKSLSERFGWDSTGN